MNEMIPSLAPVSGESSMLKNPLFYVAAEAVIFGAAGAYLYKKTSALSASIVDLVDHVGRLDQLIAEQRSMIQHLNSVVISMQAQPVAQPAAKAKVVSKPPPKRQESSPKAKDTTQSSHPPSHPNSNVVASQHPNTGEAASMMQGFPYMPSMVFISGRSHKNDTVIEEEEETSNSENTLDAELDEELKELEDEETEQ